MKFMPLSSIRIITKTLKQAKIKFLAAQKRIGYLDTVLGKL